MTGGDRLRAELDRLRRENEAQATELAELRRARRVAVEVEADRAALRASEERHRLVVESATDYAIFTMGLDRRITGWNVGAERVLGWTEAEAVGRPADMIFTPEDREAGAPEREARGAVERGRAEDVRWHLRRDGSRLWASGVMLPLRDDAGAIRGLLKILRDKTAEKRAADELRDKAGFLGRLLESSADRVEVLDLDGRLLFMGEGGRRAMEVGDFDAVRDRPWPDFWEGEENARAKAAVEAAGAGGMGRFRGFARTMAGAPRWWDVQVTPIPGADGRPERLLCVSRDITATRRAEEAVRGGEARLAALARASSDVLYRMDPDWGEMRELEGGGYLADTTGPSRAWLIDYIPADERARVSAAIDAAIRAKGVFELEHRVRRADGGVGWTVSRAVPILGGDGEIVEWVGAASDVTARREAEGRLRELNAALEARVAERTAERDRMWRLSTDLMLVARFDAAITAVNPAWTALLGWREDELIGRSFLDLVHPDDAAATLAEAGRLSRGVTTSRFENRYRHKGGGHRWLSWTAVPGAGLIHAVARDVTAERAQAEALAQAEERLRQAQKMEAVGQLTGGIAHDFNNMLQGIGGALELARKRVERGRAEDAFALMDAARQGVERAAALTHRLLAFARRQALDAQPVAVDRLVRGMAELIGRAVGPGVEVRTRMGDGGRTVLCDANGLENVLLNLAINARDAMPEGGTLTLAGAEVRLSAADVAGQDGAAPGEYVELCVSDTGAGMDEATRARAFEPFFTTKPIGQGTGLGLSQVYGFVRQSGGVVRLDSAPGRGTTVRLYLPRHRGDEAVAHARAPGQEGEGAGGVVVLVEDEVAVRAVAAEALRERGHTVLEAADGPGGLRLLAGCPRVDALVTDVGLPGMNGRQLAEAAREHRPGLPVLFITGYAGDALRGRLAPGMEVIGKPFTLDALAAKVRGMVEAGAPPPRG